MHFVTNQIARIKEVYEHRLLPAVYSHRTPVEVAVTHLPGEPIAPAQAIALDYEPTHVGMRWGRAWSTSWFRLRGQVPPEMAGKRVELVVDLGFSGGGPGFECEGLAYTAAGEPIKGLEPRTTYVPIAKSAQGGENVEIYVEAAANPTLGGTEPTPLGDLATIPDVLLYQLKRAELAVLEPEVYGLALDVQVLFELALELPEADPRRHEILRSLEVMLDHLDHRYIAADAAAARARLAPTLAARAPASAHQISAVGHAHIDSAWLWPVRETIRKCARTFSNVTALAEEYPELVFVASSAQQYVWIRDHHPQIWQRIKEAAARGQFVPVGGMWVEPDSNLIGAEALARQMVYGKRFFQQEFDVDCEEVWLPDSFGYTGALPQIARLAGFRWFLSQKMSWNEVNEFPHHTMWWEGIDGTRIFTHFPPSDTYSSKLSGEQLAFGVKNFKEKGRAKHSLLPFGYGDGGGGPTREMLEIARRVADLEGSPRVKIETPAEFFTRAEAQYADAPVWVGEMYLEMHRGTFTSQAEMKRGNRRSEHLLREAEMWCATAAVRNREYTYPREALDRIWNEVLLLQFHDILPGASIAWVHQEARESYRRLTLELEELISDALARLISDGAATVAVNSAPHPVAGIPAGGAKILADEPAAGATVSESGTDIVLENRHLRAVINSAGVLTSVRDLAAQREVLAPDSAGNVLQLHPDAPVRFDAWDIDETYRARCHDLLDVQSLEVDRSNPNAPAVVVTRAFGQSKFSQRIEIPGDEKRIDFQLDAHWQEQETLLKIGFPLDIHTDHAAAETQFGHVVRAIHTNTPWDAARFEVPAHRWFHVGEPDYGVAIVNEATYGHEATRAGEGPARGPRTTTVRLTALRGPKYPDPMTDQGHHILRYSLVPGATIADAVREGYRRNLPVRHITGGTEVAPLIACESEGVVIEAIKLADDGSDDVIVRMYESLGARASATVIPSFGFSRAEVVNLLEVPQEQIARLCPIQSTEKDGAQAVIANLSPFQVVTLRFYQEVNA